MRVVFIGGVNSSAVTLHKLIEHDLDIAMVYGFEPKNTELVSGYHNFSALCSDNGINYTPFQKINDHISEIEKLDFDVLFVVGISQLVSERIIDSAKAGAIGFHPTQLPKGRGRAPIAWLVDEVQDGAATFFVLEEEADSGAVFEQECFEVIEADTARSVEGKLLDAMAIALDRLLPKIKRGEWRPVPQDEALATEYAIRKPDDGLISWSLPAHKIDRLIKAASEPHPGAFTFFEETKIKILSSRIENTLKITGVQGRVLKVNKNEALVQSGSGLIWITPEHQYMKQLKVGHLLGYRIELEIFKLKQELQQLKSSLGDKV
ncbi:methionyl-tRNA formyltransferase [Pseudoalteromonas maricaloris]|uniref:methionyl-tRNA formyltransferase n=1 Tax=Pseudoalteromonas maricaloris TaxID=184924 RepID=UPI003C1C1766